MKRLSLLEAISKTSRTLFAMAELPEPMFFACEYTWHSRLGVMDGSTVIIGADADAALAHFKSIFPQVITARVTDRTPRTEQEFVRDVASKNPQLSTINTQLA